MILSKVVEGTTHLLYSSNTASFFTLFITESFAKHLMVLVYASGVTIPLQVFL